MESDTPLSRSEMLERGREMRRKLVGDAYADKLDSEVYRNRHMQKFGDLTQEIVFGQMWTRPDLDLKFRSLIILITDTATGSTEALQLHVRFCRIHGWSEDEIVESILHCMGYIGIPLVRKAMVATVEVFQAMQAEELQRSETAAAGK